MKVLKILTLAMCSYLIIPAMQGATKHAKETKYPSYKGMIMAGYQGWFGTPEDGKSGSYRHMAGKNGFKDGSCHIDIWPDVREYSKNLIPQNLKMPMDLQPVYSVPGRCQHDRSPFQMDERIWHRRSIYAALFLIMHGEEVNNHYLISFSKMHLTLLRNMIEP